MYEHRTEVREGLLGFHRQTVSDDGVMVFEASPDCLFRPSGLMLWDFAPRALVRMIRLSNKRELTCSWDPVPAAWFGQAQSFAEIQKMVEEKKEPAFWGTFSPMTIGSIARIEIENHEHREPLAVMWGKYAT